jgi:cellulose synthase/poly-beta-1,6-N-acetylglucosamine synthase-like glycosyltransferase
MDLIIRIRRWAVGHKRSIRMSFTSDPVCWAECPASFRMLARQRRRWQLGLCQTLWKNSRVLFSPQFGVVGLLSFPFQLYVEALGAVVELLGYALIPFAFMLGMSLPQLYLPFVILGLAYSAFLSVGSVVLEDITHRRYPTFRDLGILIFYASIENFGYRQLLLFYRFQGVIRFLTGFRQWEKVVHLGPARYSQESHSVS